MQHHFPLFTVIVNTAHFYGHPLHIEGANGNHIALRPKSSQDKVLLVSLSRMFHALVLAHTEGFPQSENVTAFREVGIRLLPYLMLGYYYISIEYDYLI